MKARPSLIFDTVLDGVFRTALVFAVFLLFAGHNAPGGGFIAGLVVVVALTARFVARGIEEVDRVLPVDESLLLGSGLLLSLLTGAGGLLWGGSFLDGTKLSAKVPLLGEVKTTTALFFDLGVFLLVIGLGLVILRVLAGPEGDESGDAT